MKFSIKDFFRQCDFIFCAVQKLQENWTDQGIVAKFHL